MFSVTQYLCQPADGSLAHEADVAKTFENFPFEQVLSYGGNDALDVQALKNQINPLSNKRHAASQISIPTLS